jgi:Fur family zinc uptake transcriptional regulator
MIADQTLACAVTTHGLEAALYCAHLPMNRRSDDMVSSSISRILNKAEHACQESGARLTLKRKQVLSTLLKTDTALSAYELADEYKNLYQEAIPVMSVYRMLDFLVQENLVHKLSTTNKYIACAHIACDHAHEIPQFMICNRCENVREVGIKKDIIGSISSTLEQAEFYLTSPQLEFHGLCKACRTQESAGMARS